MYIYTAASHLYLIFPHRYNNYRTYFEHLFFLITNCSV